MLRTYSWFISMSYFIVFCFFVLSFNEESRMHCSNIGQRVLGEYFPSMELNIEMVASSAMVVPIWPDGLSIAGYS